MGNGTKVKLYEGTIPSSGKSVIDFAGIKLCHRSVAKDKSDYLIHIETKAVIMAYPRKTDRSIVLENIAKNISTLNHFIDSLNSYELVSPDNFIENKVKTTKRERIFTTYKEPSYSTSGKFAHLNKDYVETKKKRYIVKDNKW